MANMSSFYGGRSAPSFTIVKSFDRIDASNVYTKSYYAVDNKGNIKTDTKNGWGDNLADSIVKVSNDSDIYILKRTENNFLNSNYKWNLFENNGSPIRDGINFPSITANGMIQCFNKGVTTLDEVNYQEYVLIDTVTNLNEYSNPDNGKIYRRGFDVNNGMYGAEYIGRITGPQGYNTGIQLENFETVSEANGVIQGKVESDLVGGNDSSKIECVYANVLDEGGNVLQTKIGFKFPYLVNTFKSKLVTPYNLPENLITEIRTDGEELVNLTDNPNPFYRHWSIKIPQGIKGDSIEEIRIQPTIIPANTPYYNNLETLKADIEANNNYLNKSGLITEESNILSDTYDKSNYCIILNEGTETEPIYKYIDAKLCTNKKVFYTIRDYDNLEEGSVSIPFEVGDIDSIIKTDLAEDGTLTIYYDNGKEEEAKNKIRWINDIKLNTEGSNPNYKLHVTYNTKKSDGSKEEKDIGESISYIKNLQVNTDGDQKLYVTYNIKDGTVNKEEAIGKPINYIKKLYVANKDDVVANGKLEVNCLYAEYSDPHYKSEDEYLTIKSQGEDIKWVQINTVFPEAEGIKIVKYFSNDNELANYGAPEVETNNTNSYGAAVVLNNNICIYDYVAEKWINTGAQIGDTTDPTAIVKIVGKNMLPNISTVLPSSIVFEQEPIGGR